MILVGEPLLGRRRTYIGLWTMVLKGGSVTTIYFEVSSGLTFSLFNSYLAFCVWHRTFSISHPLFYISHLAFYLTPRIFYFTSRIFYLTPSPRIFYFTSHTSYLTGFRSYLRHFSKGRVMWQDGKNEVQFHFDDLTQLLVLHKACTFYHS